MTGFGAIGVEVVRRLKDDSTAQIGHIMVRAGREDKVGKRPNHDIQVVSNFDAVDRLQDFVLECASHEAASQYAR